MESEGHQKQQSGKLPYASQAYWDQKFTNNAEAFDWLLPAPAVRDVIDATLKECPERNPQLLHIGCGTSDLSSELRRVVADARQVHNVDFSEPAIQVAMVRDDERVSAANDHPGAKGDERNMRWSTVDLLSSLSIEKLFETVYDGNSSYVVIVDKGTSDSVACLDDVEADLPYSIQIAATQPTNKEKTKASIHPLNLLAVNLAALATPITGRWVVISYEEDRFAFLSQNAQQQDDGTLDRRIQEAGFPHPGSLWTLEKKWAVELPSANDSLTEPAAHRPKVFHWVHVLARTEQEVLFHDHS